MLMLCCGFRIKKLGTQKSIQHTPRKEVIDIQKKTKPKAHFTPKFNLYIREGVGASETVLVVFPFSNQ